MADETGEGVVVRRRQRVRNVRAAATATTTSAIAPTARHRTCQRVVEEFRSVSIPTRSRLS